MLSRATLVCGLLLACAAAQAGLAFGSAHVLVVDEVSGEVLLSKDADTAAPIASLTKLMTAMVVLDAQQDPHEDLRIDAADTEDHFRHSRGGVPVGAVASRLSLLELALLASNNRAASALARHYPGGLEAFGAAMQRKTHALGLYGTLIEEPTGLSPNNVSSAQDMVKVLRAAARYPTVAQITSRRSHIVLVSGRPWTVRNTNRLVGAPGWRVHLSKTGFTNDAGRCLAMRAETGGRTVMVVLSGAARPSLRARDMMTTRRWLAGETPAVLVRAAAVRPRAPAQRARATTVAGPWPAAGALEPAAPIVEPSPGKPPQEGGAAGTAEADTD